VIVPFAYLDQQYPDVEEYLDDIRALVKTGDFTLGKAVGRFEADFAAFCNLPEAIGLASGTDALMLSLRAVGVGPGDEVITTPQTFIATVGAIAMLGARPVFVDINDELVMDPGAIERAITPQTKAIMPVHWTGTMADMPAISQIAQRHGLRIVEDACHALGANADGQAPGAYSDAACFSFHPIKHINVWGDGGIVVTGKAEVAERIRLLRNHGLKNRDEAIIWGLNSRLQSLQALIAQRQLATITAAIDRRIEHAARYDAAFADLAPAMRIPKRGQAIRHSYAVYVALVERRDELVDYLQQHGVDAKIHYPLPLHLMEAARYLGYKEGDFPASEAYGRTTVTLPVHQFLTDEQVTYTIEQVRAFYA
jgi:aminotransferase EvaB